MAIIRNESEYSMNITAVIYRSIVVKTDIIFSYFFIVTQYRQNTLFYQYDILFTESRNA